MGRGAAVKKDDTHAIARSARGLSSTCATVEAGASTGRREETTQAGEGRRDDALLGRAVDLSRRTFCFFNRSRMQRYQFFNPSLIALLQLELAINRIRSACCSWRRIIINRTARAIAIARKVKISSEEISV